MDTAQPALFVDTLSKRFGTTAVLSDITFSIQDPGIVFLLGQNGCGKSTLLKLIARLQFPDTGSVSGRHCRHDAPIGYVSHEPSLYRGLTVRENIRFFSKLLHVQTSVEETLLTWNILNIADRFPPELSQGQRLKVGLARGTLGQPQMILLDEPSAFLDDISVDLLITQLKMQKSTRCILIATHDIERLKSVAERVIILADRQLAYDSLNSSLEASLDYYRKHNR